MPLMRVLLAQHLLDGVHQFADEFYRVPVRGQGIVDSVARVVGHRGKHLRVLLLAVLGPYEMQRARESAAVDLCAGEFLSHQPSSFSRPRILGEIARNAIGFGSFVEFNSFSLLIEYVFCSIIPTRLI